MGQDSITIDRTYFKLPGDNNSDSSDLYMDFTLREQMRKYLEIMEEMQEKLKQEQPSPVEDEELDEDLEDNVQNEDEPSGEGSWQSGNKSLENVPSERFSVGKKLRNFFS